MGMGLKLLAGSALLLTISACNQTYVYPGIQPTVTYTYVPPVTYTPPPVVVYNPPPVYTYPYVYYSPRYYGPRYYGCRRGYYGQVIC